MLLYCCRYKDIIESVGWKTEEIREFYRNIISVRLSNIGRTHVYDHNIVATSPNILNTFLGEYVMMSYDFFFFS
jgi:hypothetical protein